MKKILINLLAILFYINISVPYWLVEGFGLFHIIWWILSIGLSILVVNPIAQNMKEVNLE